MRNTATVVIAVCNPNPKYFKEQLLSLVRQTRPIDELIVVDDASTEAGAVGKALKDVGLGSQHLCRVKVLRSAVNAGHTSAFTLGLLNTCCDLIFFCDQDDKWHPDKVSRCEAFFADRPETLCATHDFYFGDENLFPLERQTAMEKYAASGVSPSLVGHGFATVIRSDIKDLVVQANSRRGGHDGWIRSTRNALGAREIIREPLVIWRRHSKSHTSIRSQTRESGRNKINRFSLRQRLRDLRREEVDAVAIRGWIRDHRVNGGYHFLECADKRLEKLVALLGARKSILMEDACCVGRISLLSRPVHVFADMISIFIYKFHKKVGLVRNSQGCFQSRNR